MKHVTNREQCIELIEQLNNPQIVEEVKRVKSMSLENDAKERVLNFFFRRMGIAETTDNIIADIDKELQRRLNDPEEGLTTAQLLKYRADLALARSTDTKVVLEPLKPSPTGGNLITPNNQPNAEDPAVKQSALGATQSEVLEKVVRGLMAATESAAVAHAKNVTPEK